MAKMLQQKIEELMESEKRHKQCESALHNLQHRSSHLTEE